MKKIILSLILLNLCTHFTPVLAEDTEENIKAQSAKEINPGSKEHTKEKKKKGKRDKNIILTLDRKNDDNEEDSDDEN